MDGVGDQEALARHPDRGASLDRVERRRALASLADRVTIGDLGIDVEAAESVRRHGWNPQR